LLIRHTTINESLESFEKFDRRTRFSRGSNTFQRLLHRFHFHLHLHRLLHLVLLVPRLVHEISLAALLQRFQLLVDLGNEDDIVTLFVHDPGARLLVASSDGRGFVVKEEAVLAQTRAGKQVLNVANGVTAHVCVRIAGDHVAVVGENRKLLIFPLDDLPEMGRGRGNMLQRYQKGGLSDVTTCVGKEGLHWKIGERTRIETDIEAWMGKRGAAGRVVPKGFSKANRFR